MQMMVLSSTRCYKEPWDAERVIATIKEEAGKFYPNWWTYSFPVLDVILFSPSRKYIRTDALRSASGICGFPGAMKRVVSHSDATKRFPPGENRGGSPPGLRRHRMNKFFASCKTVLSEDQPFFLRQFA